MMTGTVNFEKYDICSFFFLCQIKSGHCFVQSISIQFTADTFIYARTIKIDF